MPPSRPAIRPIAAKSLRPWKSWTTRWDRSIARRKAEFAEERAKARLQFLDEAFHELKGAESGSISRLQEKFDLSEQRKADLAARNAQIREMHGFIKKASEKIEELDVAAKFEERG